MFRGLPLELDLLFLCVFQKCIRVFVKWRLMPILKFRFHRRRSCNAMCGLGIASSVLPSWEYVRSRFGNFVKARLPREKLRGVAIAALHVSATANESNTRNSKET